MGCRWVGLTHAAHRLDPLNCRAVQVLRLLRCHAAEIAAVEQAICLSPRDPRIGYSYGLIGVVHLLQSRTDEAIVWLEKARSASPAVPKFRSRLASAYALRGETERAATEVDEARRLTSEGYLSSIAHLTTVPGAWRGVPKIRALYEATYFAGLRKAGVPEE